MDLYTSYSDQEESMHGGRLRLRTKAQTKIGKYSKLRSQLIKQGYSSSQAKQIAHQQVFGNKKSKTMSRRHKKSKTMSRRHRGRGEELGGLLYGGSLSLDELKELKEQQIKDSYIKLLRNEKNFTARQELNTVKRQIEQQKRDNRNYEKILQKYKDIKYELKDEDITKKQDELESKYKLISELKRKKLIKDLLEQGIEEDLAKQYAMLEYPEKADEYYEQTITTEGKKKHHVKQKQKSKSKSRAKGYLYGGETLAGLLYGGGEMLAGEMLAGMHRRRKSTRKHKSKRASRMYY